MQLQEEEIFLNSRKRNRNETKKDILNEDDKRMCLLIGKPNNNKTYIQKQYWRSINQPN